MENLVNNLARVSEWNLIQLTLKLAANFQIHIILTLSKVETGIKNNEGGINLRYGKLLFPGRSREEYLKVSAIVPKYGFTAKE